MAEHKRTYGDPCGVARALDLVGERWALLVVRELLLGPKRFTDLRAGLPHVSADVLSQRLRELESAGVLRRDKLPPPAGSRVYELTSWGRELEPVVLALGSWGSQAPFPPGDAELSPDSLAIALLTVFRPTAATRQRRYELRIGEQRFDARVSEGKLAIRGGSSEAPDATISSDPGTLTRVLWHNYPLARAVRARELEIEGDSESVTEFFELFPAPQPAH
jgi:DNA-binding HxlR family transcriptional regulator